MIACLDQGLGIFVSEHLGAEAHGGVELRLAEGTVGGAGMPEIFDQLRRRGVEILLEFGPVRWRSVR